MLIDIVSGCSSTLPAGGSQWKISFYHSHNCLNELWQKNPNCVILQNHTSTIVIHFYRIRADIRLFVFNKEVTLQIVIISGLHRQIELTNWEICANKSFSTTMPKSTVQLMWLKYTVSGVIRSGLFNFPIRRCAPVHSSYAVLRCIAKALTGQRNTAQQ